MREMQWQCNQQIMAITTRPSDTGGVVFSSAFLSLERRPKGEVGMTLHGQTKYVTRKEILGVLRTKVGVGLAKNLYPNHM